VRPTSDKIREAVFGILGDINGASVLDLFAGTGAMGLEALSRGAAHATFVEIDRQAHGIVRRNIDATVSDRTSSTDLVKGDATRVVQTLAMAGERYNIVFFDPPYDRTEKLVAATSGTLNNVCEPGTVIVLELATRYKNVAAQAAAAWGAEITLERTYGDTHIVMLEVTQITEDMTPRDVEAAVEAPVTAAGD